MDTLSDLILQIYRAARETPVDEYQDFVLSLVRSLVPHTSSRWVTVELTDRGAVTHCAHLQNEPTDIIVDWDSINRMDRAIHILVTRPGKALSVHTETFYADREYAEMLDYTRRYRHANALCVAEMAAAQDFWHGLSLYRHDPDDHFSRNSELLLERLMPHMVEALTQNRLLALHRAGAPNTAMEESNGAIADTKGQVYYAGSGFNRLLQEEWPDWKGVKLPKVLLDALSRCGGDGFSGVATCISATRVGHLIFLRATPRCILTRLSPRESSVAKLYGQGLSHKEIARRLDISPATARNFIRHIYDKLEVNDKAELAAIVSRSKLSPEKRAAPTSPFPRH